MSYNHFGYYQQGSQSSQWAPTYMQSPQQPTVAMLTSQQAPFQAQPFPLATTQNSMAAPPPPPRPPPSPSPAFSQEPAIPPRPQSRSTTARQDDSEAETVEEEPVSKRKKGKSKSGAKDQSQVSRAKAMPSWTRNKINGRAEEQYMLDLCCKPEFWTRWRGGDPKFNKSETIKWINRERRNFGFDFDRPQNSIDTKAGVKSIEGKFQEVIRWKSETGQGLKDDDEHQGRSVRDVILNKCPRFYDLWEVLSRRMGTIPQGLWSTGDDADPTLEMMYQLVSNNGGLGGDGDGSDDAEGETENDSDGGLSEASMVRRERLARARSVTGGGPATVATPIGEQPSLESLTGQFESQPRGPRFPGRVTPPPSTPTPSGGRRVKNVVAPKEASSKRRDVVSDILSASEKRLEFDEKRFEFEQAIRREELEEARRERELERELRKEEREREREDARLEREREKAEKVADQAAWDENWRRERAGGVELMAFVAAFGNRP